MKTTLKLLLRRFGIAAVSTRHISACYLDHPPRSLFDYVLMRCFPKLEALTFMQVGANDGRRFDPINTYVSSHGWHGVMVEPVPSNFRQLNKTYANNSRLRLIQAAVDLKESTRTIHHLREDLTASVPEWMWGLASFNRDHVLEVTRQQGWPDDSVGSTDVPTLTWAQLWKKLPGTRCDILVVDTEGYDITLLRAAGLGERLPKLIHFEHSHTPLEDRISFYRELIDLGYELATDGPDTTAWLCK